MGFHAHLSLLNPHAKLFSKYRIICGSGEIQCQACCCKPENTEPILNARRAEGDLEVVDDFYDLKSGKVWDVA
jgi:hypothetical protein